MSSLAPELTSLLVCPLDRQPLQQVPGRSALYNTRLRKLYEVRNGVPVMLVSEARDLSDSEHDEITALIAGGSGGSQKFEEN